MFPSEIENDVGSRDDSFHVVALLLKHFVVESWCLLGCISGDGSNILNLFLSFLFCFFLVYRLFPLGLSQYTFRRRSLKMFPRAKPP